MTYKTLNVRAFAETIRSRMNKKSRTKDFETDSKTLQEQDLTKIFNFYYQLLKAVTYYVSEDGIADIAPSLTTQLKNGKSEVPQKILEIAQRKETRKAVIEYFSVNVAPNIPATVFSSVLNDIDDIVQSDKGIDAKKRKSLKKLKVDSKDGSSYLADVWLFAICNGRNIDNNDKTKSVAKLKTGKRDTEFAQDMTGNVIDKLDTLINELPQPPTISPTPMIEEHEMKYIAALYDAYRDAIGIDDFDESILDNHPLYKEDLAEQRIDYFAAYSVERGVLEFTESSLNNQFTALKEEIFSGVRNTAIKKYANGFDRLSSVMEQAVRVSADLYILSRSPYWINNKIKKGTCHFLVIDNKLKWVMK